MVLTSLARQFATKVESLPLFSPFALYLLRPKNYQFMQSATISYHTFYFAWRDSGGTNWVVTVYDGVMLQLRLWWPRALTAAAPWHLAGSRGPGLLTANYGSPLLTTPHLHRVTDKWCTSYRHGKVFFYQMSFITWITLRLDFGNHNTKV